jgi:putative ABC transport system permease protein
VARLKPGVTAAQAQAEMSRINASLAKEYPDSNLHFAGAKVEPELQHLVGDVTPALLNLFGAVGCVLLIACANVGSLLLARSMTRRKEISIRAALGAARGRVVRQLLTESILLAVCGGLLGLALALWGTAGLSWLIPENIPRLSEIAMNAHVFAFTLVAALATGILFGLAPALQSSKANVVEALQSSDRGITSGKGYNRLRGALVVSEMALALPLLAGAGLMIQSFARLASVNPGFNAHNLLTFTFYLPETQYKTGQQKVFYEQFLGRLKTLPGVESAAATVPLPLSGSNDTFSFSIEGRPVAAGNNPSEETRMVSPGYFRTMGVLLIEGREFAETDTPKSPPVVIVNQAFARRYFPNESAVGKHMNPSVSDAEGKVEETPMREIVGVVGDEKTRALNRQDQPEYFLPYQQALISNLTFVLRTRSAPAGVVAPAREALQSMDRQLPLYGIKTMDDYLGASVAQPRFSMLLLSIFAGLATALTALGLYGVISYSVAQRTHEIGIRMALGAQRSDVLRMVIREGALLAAGGWAAGLVLGIALTRFLSSQLFGIHTTDALTYAMATMLLGTIALAACYIPARRATHVDPIVALRYE